MIYNKKKCIGSGHEVQEKTFQKVFSCLFGFSEVWIIMLNDGFRRRSSPNQLTNPHISSSNHMGVRTKTGVNYKEEKGFLGINYKGMEHVWGN